MKIWDVRVKRTCKINPNSLEGRYWRTDGKVDQAYVRAYKRRAAKQGRAAGRRQIQQQLRQYELELHEAKLYRLAQDAVWSMDIPDYDAIDRDILTSFLLEERERGRAQDRYETYLELHG